MKKLFILFIFTLFTITATAQRPRYVQNGLRFGGSELPTTAAEGWLKYDFTAHGFTYYNGTEWTTLGGGVATPLEGYFEVGTQAGGDLNIVIGDYTQQGNGSFFAISDTQKKASFEALAIDNSSQSQIQNGTFTIQSKVFQSGLEGYTSLKVQAIEQSVGFGERLLAHFKGEREVKISSNGVVFTTATAQSLAFAGGGALATKDYVDSASGTITTVKVTLTAAEVIASGTSPHVLINSQGVGTVINIIKIAARVRVLSTPFTFSGLFAGKYNIRFTGGVNNYSLGSGFAQSTFTRIGDAIPSSSGSFVETSLENTSLEVQLTSAPTNSGDSEIDFYVTYEILSL
jgi:hypothetical protein